MWDKRLTIFSLLILISGCNALFEDQVGKFDWRVQHLGCPNDILLQKSKFGHDQLLVSTSRNVVGSIDVNSGEIVWRQLNEESNKSLPPKVLLSKDDLFSIINGGEYLRVFDRETGVLKWQHRLNAQGLEQHDVVLKGRFKFIRVQNTIFAFDKSTKPIWQVKLASEIEWKAIVNGEKHVIAIGRSNSGGLRIRFYSYTDGKEVKLQADDVANDKFAVNDCLFSGSALVCLNGRTLNTAYLTDGAFTRLSFVEIEGVDSLSDLRSLNRPGLFTVRVGDKLSLLRVDEKASEVVLTTKYGNIQTCGAASAFGVYVESKKKLQIFDQNTKKEIAEIEIPSDGFAPVKKIALLEIDNNQSFEIVVVRNDCRVDFYEARRAEKTAVLEWSRFEGLAEISSVEMIDLPLSDSQATIETEFSVPDATILKSFLLRVTGQFGQLRRSFIALGNQFAEAFRLFTSGTESFSNVIRVLYGETRSPNKRPRSGASLDESKLELPMERDYFNLHKLIIVTTKSGSVYGIHNQYGTVVWSLYLGTQSEPMTTQMGATKIPLFIQRTTANFQFDSQAAVVFNLKGTKKTRIVLFNPVNGKVVNSHTYDSISRVELAPFTNKESLSPLIVVDSSGKIKFLPEVDSDFQSPQSIHLFSVDTKRGTLKGDVVRLHQNSLTNSWSTNLNLGPDEKIVSIAGKNRYERVHSQGKVLGDRSVLYKYSNPNLVAIASVDSAHTLLSINFVDAVTGTVIYTAKQERASEPVNLLHCENWVVYSYWNEKSRRTELGIIELYEGLEQTNAKYFNSFTTVKHPLNAISNSFVFPQGISAMAASDTEQGLTTRSVVIAMPFGGILEVSKRLLDARRPIEMTADLREEMIIPYMPEIPLATEDLINYNQTVMQIEGIKTAASGLESTSLMLAYGLDLFYTRLTPSGTFDVLKDDFDYPLISVVLLGLLIASFVLKRISRHQNLKQAWA